MCGVKMYCRETDVDGCRRWWLHLLWLYLGDTFILPSHLLRVTLVVHYSLVFPFVALSLVRRLVCSLAYIYNRVDLYFLEKVIFTYCCVFSFCLQFQLI